MTENTPAPALRCHCGEPAAGECGTPCCACMDYWIAENEPAPCPCGNSAALTSPAAVASAPTVSLGLPHPGEQRGRLGPFPCDCGATIYVTYRREPWGWWIQHGENPEHMSPQWTAPFVNLPQEWVDSIHLGGTP